MPLAAFCNSAPVAACSCQDCAPPPQHTQLADSSACRCSEVVTWRGWRNDVVHSLLDENGGGLRSLLVADDVWEVHARTLASRSLSRFGCSVLLGHAPSLMLSLLALHCCWVVCAGDARTRRRCADSGKNSITHKPLSPQDFQMWLTRACLNSCFPSLFALTAWGLHALLLQPGALSWHLL
jgi:hypothetical protein